MTRTSSGLQCSWGSELDFKIPRAKMPKRALPPSVRSKMGFKKEQDKRQEDDQEEMCSYWKPGFGMEEVRRGSNKGYHAGNQKCFLKKGSGVPMSERASRAAQLRRQNSGRNTNSFAVVSTQKSVSTKSFSDISSHTKLHKRSVRSKTKMKTIENKV